MARLPVSSRALAAARGDEPSDLLFVGGKIFLPVTKEWLSTELAVCDGYIVGFGKREAKETIDAGGAALVPGFIDAHIHLESTKLWIDEFIKSVLVHGTTAVAADPHEIANVFGIRGVAELARAASGLPFTFGITASSCVPASPFESPGASIGTGEVHELLEKIGAIGVAEVMNYPGVIQGLPDVAEKILAAGHRRVDGHAPGLRGKSLDAYLAAGVESDHECFLLEEAIEKRQKGMWIFIREGSAGRNLSDLIPMVKKTGTARTALCTDDREPDQLRKAGHINDCVRLAVKCGLPVEDALVMATMNPADYHNFHNLGQLAPGFQADILVFDNLKSFKPSMVFQRGVKVASDGIIEEGVIPSVSAPEWMISSVNLHHRPAPEELDIKMPRGKIRVIGVEEGSIATRHLILDPEDRDLDIGRLAALERHRGTGRTGLGFVSGFGIKRGAIASTVSHDAHNMMILGAMNEKGPVDMAVAASHLEEIGGGQVAVLDGKVIAEVPLPVGGLMSNKSAGEVADEIHRLTEITAVMLGVEISSPFMHLSFLGLSVIPELRLSDRGLIDVNSFELTSIEAV